MTELLTTISSTVIFLMVGTPEKPIPIGTAFVVGYPHPENSNAVIPIIVTAKHVIAGRSKVFARYSTAKGGTTGLVLYDLDGLKKKGDYWEHPTEKGVDIAVFRSPAYKGTAFKFVPMDLIATEKTIEEETIRQTDRILFPSLLSNFMGLNQNYPVMKDGSIALIPDEDVPMEIQFAKTRIKTKQRVILLNATSIPGASGSPVFLAQFRG